MDEQLHLSAMTIPVRQLDNLPPNPRESMLAAGKVHQDILHLDRAAYFRIISLTSDLRPPTSAPIRLRSPFEIAALVTICESCAILVNGRCASLKGCGCNRRPEDWARLSTHHCPEKKW